MQTLFRLFRFAWQGIMRNIWLAMATVTVLGLTLLTMNAVVVLNVIADGAVRSIETKLSVDIYFTGEASDQMKTNARGYLASLPQVADVQVVPADQALTAFKERFANEPEILAALDEVGENPLSDGLTVTARRAEDLPFLLEAIRTPEYAPYIRQTVADDDVIAALKNFSLWTDRIQRGGALLAVFFALVAAMIIYNTMRMTIYTHREEIAVMRLVGAKTMLIRGPFLLEAAVYTTLAVAGAGILTMFVAALTAPTLQHFFGMDIGVTAFFQRYAFEIFGTEWLALFSLCAVATMLAMRKYLRT